MATPEGKVKRWLDTMLKRECVYFFSPQAGPYGTAGIADRVGIICGLFFAMEVKADASKKMTALQERFKEKVEASGGYHFLVYDKATVEEVRQFISHVRAGNPRQKDSCASDTRPKQRTRRNTYGKTSKRKLGISPSPPGRNTDTAEPRARYT